MTHLTPRQQRVRGRIEGLIRAAAPALDLILATGEVLSRVLAPRDTEQAPVRPAPEPALLEPGAASQDGRNE